jgi:hypothetical protein
VDLRDSVIGRGIANDTAWMGRLVADMTDPASRQCIPIFSFCFMPYTALFVYESYEKLKTINLTLATKVRRS